MRCGSWSHLQPHTLAIALAIISLAAGCQRATPAEKPSGEARPLGAEVHRITLAPDVVAATRIRVELPTREYLDALIEVPGQTAADPDRIASIASPIAGRIETVSARLGESVRKGDVLFTIRVPDLSKLRADAAAKQALNS